MAEWLGNLSREVRADPDFTNEAVACNRVKHSGHLVPTFAAVAEWGETERKRKMADCFDSGKITRPLDGLSWLGPTTPVGGLLSMVAWFALGVNCLKKDKLIHPSGWHFV